jgi:hypothetical protein
MSPTGIATDAQPTFNGTNTEMLMASPEVRGAVDSEQREPTRFWEYPRVSLVATVEIDYDPDAA